MDNDKKIVRFEDLFGDKEPEKTTRKRPEGNRHHLYALFVYVLVMYIFAAVLFLVASEIPMFQKNLSIEERVLTAASQDKNAVVLFNNLDYLDYRDDYSGSLMSIGLYRGHLILINRRNQDAFDLLFTNDIETGESYFDVSKFEKTLGVSPQYTNWSTQGGKIMFYYGISMTEPSDVRYANRMVFETPGTTLSDFGISAVNFGVYIALLPLVLILLKRDLVLDFDEVKTKRQEVLIPVIIGYVMIIAGNYVSQLLSGFLADILNIIPSEAVNQITIINALKSEGVVLMLVSAILLGPIVEELIFRKAFFGLIKSDKWALFLSSFVFGTIHLIGEASIGDALVNGISYYVMGFVFGYIYLRNDRNIWIPIFVHVLSNLISVVAILILY